MGFKSPRSLDTHVRAHRLQCNLCLTCVTSAAVEHLPPSLSYTSSSPTALFLSGVEFVDERIDFAQWPARKPSTPYGSLPLLEWGDRQLAQSNTILRLVGRWGNLCALVHLHTFSSRSIFSLRLTHFFSYPCLCISCVFSAALLLFAPFFFHCAL